MPPNSPKAPILIQIQIKKQNSDMKSNDKENYINELKPHLEASSGYALSLVEGEQSSKSEGTGNGSVLGCNANNSNESVRSV